MSDLEIEAHVSIPVSIHAVIVETISS